MERNLLATVLPAGALLVVLAVARSGSSDTGDMAREGGRVSGITYLVLLSSIAALAWQCRPKSKGLRQQSSTALLPPGSVSRLGPRRGSTSKGALGGAGARGGNRVSRRFPWAPARWDTSQDPMQSPLARVIQPPANLAKLVTKQRPAQDRRSSGFLAPDATPEEIMREQVKSIRNALREDRMLASEEPIDLQSSAAQEPQLYEPIDDYTIGRFLLAGKFDEQKALSNLRNYIAWRREGNGVVTPPTEWLDAGPVVVPFEDKNGRPVVIFRARYFEPTKQPMETLERGYCSTLDAVVGHMLRQRREGKDNPDNPLEQYTIWIDVQGASRSNFALEGLKMMQRVATQKYCERSGKMYVLGANLVVRMLWKTVKGLLLERTQKNINLIAAEDVPRVLREMMGDRTHELPTEYGGSAPAFLEPRLCKTLEEKAGLIAATAWRDLGAAPEWDVDATPGGSQGHHTPAQALTAASAARRQSRATGLSFIGACSPCFAWLSREVPT